MGQSGGKITLRHLLSRFWDVDSECVTLDGQDVRDYDMDSLMQNFSFVFQRIYLFHDTVANNIYNMMLLYFAKHDLSGAVPVLFRLG